MRRQSALQAMAEGGTVSALPEIASQGGRLATLISMAAFVFSGFSLYESTLKQPKLESFVPPVIHYGRDGGGDIELFAIPITVTNDGARAATVLSMERDVTDSAGITKKYYSAYLGGQPTMAGGAN